MKSNTYMVAGQTFELKHYGVKGMKWGRRKARLDMLSAPSRPGGTYGANQQMRKRVDTLTGRNSGGTYGANQQMRKRVDKMTGGTMKDRMQKIAGTELAKRGKSAIDVLMNGDKDWMGRSTSSDNVVTEAKNRGKAALERLMYSEERIHNKKFFGEYDPFG